MEAELHPDAAWVAGLANCSLERARTYLEEAANDRALFRHIVRKHREGGRPSYIEIDAPYELYALARLTRPRHIVEVGVSSGVSSAYLLRALERNRAGTLHSIDLPKSPSKLRSDPPRASWAIPEGKSSGWAVPKRLHSRWDLRIGNKKDLIPVLAEELDAVDLFVYDVPHEDRASTREFRAVDERFHAGSVAVADHGPGGGLCGALRSWSSWRSSTPLQCQDLGLYGFRSHRESAA
jgi:hypothetical protein